MNCLEGSFRSLEVVKNVKKMLGWVPWLPLYRVQGQGMYKEEGSPNQGVVSLREGLANLTCKLRRLVEHVWTWLSSWSCSHIVVLCDVVLLCRPW